MRGVLLAVLLLGTAASAAGAAPRLERFPMLSESFPAAPVRPAGFEFPVVGAHRIGTLPDQRFGGIRGHKGQDVFAECGTPIVAATAGRVYRTAYEGAAGNYTVIDGADGRWYVYMHLRAPAQVTDGDRVAEGDPLGRVGRTGDADGCHLHFEIWTPPGWFQGGVPIDPYDELRVAEARRAATAQLGRAHAGL